MQNKSSRIGEGQAHTAAPVTKRYIYIYVNYDNPGGTNSYNLIFNVKQKKSRVQAFYDAHVNKDGQFDNPTIEEQYVSVYCLKFKVY